jgi:NarL family two-component system sensor histidine kinase LiaS
MRKALRLFRRLQWRLTLLYILITLVAALTLDIGATIAVALIKPPKTPLASPSDILTNAMLFTEAPQLATYLGEQPIDQAALNTWVAAWSPSFIYSKLGFVPQATTVTTASAPVPTGYYAAHDVTIVIFGADGKPLASTGLTTHDQGAIQDPITQTLLQTELAGNGKAGARSATLKDGRTVICASIVAADSRKTLGALMVAATLIAGPPEANAAPSRDQITATIESYLPTTLGLIALACLIGTLSGVLASRGITRRLRAITLAADAWSHGDFQASVHDPGGDELGELAADLNAMAANLQRLLFARQELAAIEERQRLARDLHDSVKQRTFVLSMLVGAARALVTDNAEAERALGEAEVIASQTQQELTGIIRALRPPALSDGTAPTLSATLRESSAVWSQTTDIAAQFDAQGEAVLSPEVERELALVAREALTNVARHSGATAVEISLVIENDAATLTIQDNGHGFLPTTGEGSGIGLSSMRERMQTLGGTLEVVSGAQGTRVVAHVNNGAHDVMT